MSFVLDCSIALAFVYPDEKDGQLQSLFDCIVTDGARVPSLWRLEMANALTVAIRRGRITKEFRDQTLADLDLLNICVDPDTDRFAWTATLQLADKYKLTLYDAAYLELAHRLSLPLATLDEDLCKAARASGVAVLGG